MRRRPATTRRRGSVPHVLPGLSHGLSPRCHRRAPRARPGQDPDKGLNLSRAWQERAWHAYSHHPQRRTAGDWQEDGRRLVGTSQKAGRRLAEGWQEASFAGGWHPSADLRPDRPATWHAESRILLPRRASPPSRQACPAPSSNPRHAPTQTKAQPGHEGPPVAAYPLLTAPAGATRLAAAPVLHRQAPAPCRRAERGRVAFLAVCRPVRHAPKRPGAGQACHAGCQLVWSITLATMTASASPVPLSSQCR